MSQSLALHCMLPRKVDTLATRHAFFGFGLHALSGGSIKERLAGQTLLLTRLEAAAGALPGASRALELRYIVQPGTAANGWHEQVTCALLARLSAWDGDSAGLRRQAMQFGMEIIHLLANTLPGYRFTPFTRAAEVRAALDPFPIMDTGEVRQRVPPGERALPLPLLGIPDADMIIEMMLRQPTPTLLSIALEPTAPPDAAPLRAPSTEPPPPDIAVGAIRRHEDGSELPTMEALTRAYDVAATQRWQTQHALALRQRAFRLRVQLAGAGMLSDALVATLVGEAGGPGRLTAESTWQEPSLPLAAGAVWARPRTTVPRGAVQREASVALANLRTLAFDPWDAQDTSLVGLADLGEATRLFALPHAAPWLAAPSAAQKLAFTARVPATDGLRLGVNRVRDDERPIHLPLASRNLHLWVVGQTGTGKSTLLESLILQDIHAGRGVICIDPHGDLIAPIIGKIPARRKQDVIIFDPADDEHIVGINPLIAATEAQKALVVSAFLALLRKLYDPFNQGITGPRFEHAARNGLLTVMSMPAGGTLIDFMRAFTDDRFRNQLLPHVTDPLVRRYWLDQIAHTQDFHRSEVLDWVVSKFGRFVTDPTIRRIVGQSRSSFSFREAMDSGKIVLLSLAKGLVGSDNANFLGLVLLPMILHAALSRADTPGDERRDVALYIDEFQNYATDSLALMLAEARKYHLALTLANQHIGQLTHEIRDAVIGNVGSILSFRLGVADAAIMEQILAPTPVGAQHFVSLPNYTAYGRLMVDRQRTPVFTVETEMVPHRYDAARAERMRDLARRRYGRPRAEVDAEINARSQL